MAKNCKYYLEKLSAYLDNELNSAQREGVEVHLNCCADCRQYLNDLERIHGYTQDIYSSVRKNAHQDSVWNSIAAQLAENGSGTVKNPILWGRKRFAVWISSAVAACLILLSGFFAYYAFLKLNRNQCIVTWVESKKAPVMVYKDKSTNTTIIWMFSDENSVSNT